MVHDPWLNNFTTDNAFDWWLVMAMLCVACNGKGEIDKLGLGVIKKCGFCEGGFVRDSPETFTPLAESCSLRNSTDVARIAELEAQLKTAKEKEYEWREFAELVGNPFRSRCGHLVNRGWRCLVCGKDPSED